MRYDVAALVLMTQLGSAAVFGQGVPAVGSGAKIAPAERVVENAAVNHQAGSFTICITRHRVGREGGSLTFCPAPNQAPGNLCSCAGTPAPGLAVELNTRNPPRSGPPSTLDVDPGAQADFLKRLRECCR
jgi:hypothetical protein